MPEGSTQLVSGAGTDDVRLVVRMVPQQDRFAHELYAVHQDREVLLLRSLEGDSQNNLPPSPPFQQLSVEPIAGRDVALLTGMAGQLHWSGSIEPSSDSPSVRFDVATRLHSEDAPQQLGSRYELVSPASWLGTEAPEYALNMKASDSAAESRAARVQASWTLGADLFLGGMPMQLHVRIEAPGSETSITGERTESPTAEDGVRWDPEQRQIEILPLPDSEPRNPVRWIYAISLSCLSDEQVRADTQADESSS
jgi:hypothetical protein